MDLKRPWKKSYYEHTKAHFWYVDVGEYTLNVVPAHQQAKEWCAVIQLKSGSELGVSKRLPTVQAAAKKAVKMMQDEVAKMKRDLNAVATV